MMDPPPNLQPGEVLEGRYRLEGLLGQGGVGWVFRARHMQLQSEVAIKVLQTTFAAHSMMRPRFVREARAMAALKHPHIVTITDFSVEGDQPYIVMELLEGKTLREAMNEGPFDPERARRVMAHVLDGLSYAHGKGFVHRDLKPDNLFLLDLKSDDAFPKILDFGFVKLIGGEEPAPSDVLTRSGIAFGTPAYMSPEQATGAPADRRSDLYSLSIVFYEMLAGQRPYQGSLPEIVRQHLTAPVPTFAQLGLSHQQSQPLHDFFVRAMAKEADERFDNATEMKEALLALPLPYMRRDSKAPEALHVMSSAPTVAAPRSRPSTSGASVPLFSADLESMAAPEPVRAPRKRPSIGRRLFFLGLVLGLGLAVYFVPLTPDALPNVGGTGTPNVEGPATGTTPTAGAPAPNEGDVRASSQRDRVAHAGGPTVAAEIAAAHAAEVAPEADDPVEPEATVDDVDDATAEDDAAAQDDATAEDDAAAQDDATAEDAAGAGRPNPFQRAAPSWITRARRRVLSGRDLGTRTEEALKRYARSHRDDPRPHLILAQSFRARGWDASCMERYELAYRINPTAAGDPRMPRDLVRMSARSTDPRRAAALVQRIFRADARASVDAALADSSYTPEEIARLRALRRRL